jgi:hypothetical protein
VSQSASTKIQEAQIKVNRDVQVAQAQPSLALTVIQDPPTQPQRSVEELHPFHSHWLNVMRRLHRHNQALQFH